MNCFLDSMLLFGSHRVGNHNTGAYRKSHKKGDNHAYQRAAGTYCRKCNFTRLGSSSAPPSYNNGVCRIEKLIQAVNEKDFGALVDIGNFLCADEECAHAVARLAPYAKHAHAKDFYVKDRLEDPSCKGWFKSRGGRQLCGAVFGKGQVPVQKCVEALRAGGYDGYLNLEFEGLEDPMLGVTEGMARLKNTVETL